jgi:hypothetical protein
MSRRAAEDDLAEPAAAFDAHHDHLRVALDGDVEDRLGNGDLDLLGDREALDLEALARCARR